MADIRVEQILGTVSDREFCGRTVYPVHITWGDARKHRQVIDLGDGREVELRLPRGALLTDGMVLWDDGIEVGVVRRPAEDAMVLEFAANAGADGVRGALLLGYWLGNQHAPLEVTDTELRTPLFTGERTARETFTRFGLTGDVRPVELAAGGWTATSADHHHHDSGHHHHHD